MGPTAMPTPRLELPEICICHSDSDIYIRMREASDAFQSFLNKNILAIPPVLLLNDRQGTAAEQMTAGPRQPRRYRHQARRRR